MDKPLRRTALVSALSAALGGALTAVAGGRPELVLSGLQTSHAHAADGLLVEVHDSAPASQQAAVRQCARKLETVRGDKGQLALVKLSPVMPIVDAVRALRKHPAVEYAHPHGIYRHTAAANDAYWTNGWL